MSGLQAPWVGLCKDDYYGYEEQDHGECACCGAELEYDGFKVIDGERYCKSCAEIAD